MIHKTSIIDPNAKIASNVEIGPYCVIGPNVEIGENTIIHSHVNISASLKLEKEIRFILLFQLMIHRI